MNAAAKAKAAAAKAAADAERQYNDQRAASKIDFFPSSEQIEWLKIMDKHKMLDPESVDDDKALSESSNSLGKVYFIKTTDTQRGISEFKCGKLVSVTRRTTGLSGLEYVFTDSNGTNFNVSTGVNIEIYSLYKDDLPTHDPRLPDKEKLVVTKPTTEQLKWLSIMDTNQLLTPLSGKLTNDNIGTYYLYRDPKTSPLLVGGYLFKVENTTLQMGGGADNWWELDGSEPSPPAKVSEPSPPAKVYRNVDVSIYSFYDENGNVENNVRDINSRIYTLPPTLPTRNPLLPEKLITTPPTPEQLEWMDKMRLYVTDGTFEKVLLTTDNIGTCYLYKQYNDTPLSGGNLFKVKSTIFQVGGETDQMAATSSYNDNSNPRYVSVDVYTFSHEYTDNTTVVRSDKGVVYALPARLPITPPKPRSFKRIVDVDDVTGEFTLHDGSTVTFPQDKLEDYYFIQNPQPKDSNNPSLSVSDCIYPYQKEYTGKIVTSHLVQKICGDINGDGTEKYELYLQCQNTTFDTVTTSDTVATSDTVTSSSSIKSPLTLFSGYTKMEDDEWSEIRTISENTKETQIGEKLCKTRADPVQSVKGPVIPSLRESDETLKKLVTPYNASLHKDFDIYIRWGYYLVKVKIVGSSNNSHFIVGSTLPNSTTHFRLIKDLIFVLNRDINVANHDKELYVLRNIKPIPKTHKMKMGETIYFYLNNDRRKSAIPGIIVKIVKKAMFSSTYTVQYKDEDGVEKETEVKASELYQRDKDAEKNEAKETAQTAADLGLSLGGKKNKTKRIKIRKSLKKKQLRKSRNSRISVKAKSKRYRVRK